MNFYRIFYHIIFPLPLILSLPSQNDVWNTNASSLFHVRLTSKNTLLIEKYTDSEKPDTVLIPLPDLLKKEKKIQLHELLFMFDKMFIVFKLSLQHHHAVLEINPDSMNAFRWYPKISEQHVKSAKRISLMLYDSQTHRYEAFKIRDSSGERIFMNKLQRTPEVQHPWKFEKIWQYDFEKRPADKISVQKIIGPYLLLTVHLSRGDKKGWWALLVDDHNGKVKYHRRLNREDSIPTMIYHYHYDSVSRYHAFIIGKQFTIEQFGRNKDFSLLVLDSVLEPVRTWSLYPNIHMKKLKEMQLEKFQPLHFNISVKNEVDFYIYVWCWGRKNGYYFPISLNFKKISIDAPQNKYSLNNEPQDLLVRESDFIHPNPDSLPSQTDILDFPYHYPFFLNKQNLYYTVWIPSGKKHKALFTLQPVEKENDRYTFNIIDKKETERNSQTQLFITSQSAWLVDLHKNKITYYKSLR